MVENLKEIFTRIDGLCKPIFKLGDGKGVTAKDIEKNFNKGPLVVLAFDLFSCLHDTKKILEDQSKHIAKLDTSLDRESANHDLVKSILDEVKQNRKTIVEIKSSLEEKSEKIVTEDSKVSTFAEILKKNSASSTNIQLERSVSKAVSKSMKIERKKEKDLSRQN